MTVTKSDGCVFADLGLQRPTDPELLERLRKSAGRKLTSEERHAQCISFIVGMTGYSREYISKILDRN